MSSDVQMRAVVLSAPRRLTIQSTPVLPLRPHEVRVRVQAVGLCGTDVHIVSGEANYHFAANGRPVPLEEQPQILGHEITGVVAEVGDDVPDVSVGDRVVVDQGRTCVGEGRTPVCEYCATGDSHQCEQYREHGITGLPGGFAEYVSVPARNTVRLERDVEPAVAALTEPLGCVTHSCDVLLRTPARYSLQSTDNRSVQTVVICGAGPAGLLFVQYLRNVLGYDGVLLVSEPNQTKRALAERFGAETVDPASEDIAATVRERSGGRLAQLLIEASGSGAAFAGIARLIRKQATVLLYGHGHGGVDLSVLNQLQFLEPTLLAATGASGGFEADGRPATYVRALHLIESRKIDVGSLVSHRYAGLEAVPLAFAGDYYAADYVKGVVLPS